MSFKYKIYSSILLCVCLFVPRATLTAQIDTIRVAAAASQLLDTAIVVDAAPVAAPHHENTYLGFNTDIHAHISLKPYNMHYPSFVHPTVNLWQEYTADAANIYKWTRHVRKAAALPPFTSSNLDDLAKGNVRVAFASICPIQWEFSKPSQALRLFAFNKSKLNNMVAYYAGANAAKIEAIRYQHLDYFQDLLGELSLWQRGNGQPSPDGKYTYRIAQNFSDIEQISQQPNTIAIVLNIEGAHSLGCGGPNAKKMADKNPAGLHQNILQNIQQLKQQPFRIFSITFANHYYNQLCGQTRTHSGIISVAAHSEHEGQNEGISALGYMVLDELLSDKNGKRILIDVKHMSLKARMEYYEWLQKKYGNSIPILYSHGAVNGLPKMADDFKWNEKKQEWQFIADKKKDNRKSYLNQWSVNLYDDEILRINQTRGLIGIMLEDIRIAGKESLKDMKRTMEGSGQHRDEFLKALMANVFHIVKTVGNQSAWDIIAVGSDFDGAISPMPRYQDASRFVELRRDLEEFLTNIENHQMALNKDNYLFDNAEIIQLFYGYSPKIIVDKLLAQNTINFLARNF